MRQYHLSMDHRMFDFATYYHSVASRLPVDAVIAEVGIADGASAIYLAEALLNEGKPWREFYWVDDLSYGKQDQLTTVLNHARKADLAGIVTMFPYDSLNASCHFPDHLFDFVFIDASHRYEETKADLRLWYRKVKDGGILAGHDYNMEEVRRAVHEVIPKRITKPVGLSAGHPSLPISVLQTEDTRDGHGIWWVEKKEYIKLK